MMSLSRFAGIALIAVGSGASLDMPLSPEACEDEITEEVGLLQVAQMQGNTAVQQSRGGMEASSSDEFFFKQTTKYCSFGSICAEQTNKWDFTKLGGLCIAMTGGLYNPMDSDLPEGACQFKGFSCPASPDAVKAEITSERMTNMLPEQFRAQAAAASRAAGDKLEPLLDGIRDAILQAMGDSVQIYTKKSGLFCPSPSPVPSPSASPSPSIMR